MPSGTPLHVDASPSRGRDLGLLAFGIILVIATLAVPLLSGASTYRGGLNVSVDQGDRLSGNVYIAAPDVTFDANAPGNVSILTVTGEVRGRINGSLTMLAGRTSVRADIDGSVHVAGGDVTIHGNVGGDLVVAGGNVSLKSGSIVSGDVIVAGGKVRLDGTVRGTVYGSAVNILHSGTVEGDMQLQTSRLVLDDGARVSGDLRYQSSIDGKIAGSAQVMGLTERTNATPWTGVGADAMSPFGSLLKLTWSLLAGAVVIAAMPRLTSRVAEHASQLLQPAAVGVLSLFLIPVVALLLIVTVIGIPIGVFLLMLLPIALYLSQVFVGLTIGRFLMPRSWRDGSRGFLLLAMTLGVLIIAVLRMLPVPFIGPVITAIVTFWGLGAAVMLLTDLTSSRLRERAT